MCATSWREGHFSVPSRSSIVVDTNLLAPAFSSLIATSNHRNGAPIVVACSILSHIASIRIIELPITRGWGHRLVAQSFRCRVKKEAVGQSPHPRTNPLAAKKPLCQPEEGEEGKPASRTIASSSPSMILGGFTHLNVAPHVFRNINLSKAKW
jgi:hypothetical protein